MMQANPQFTAIKAYAALVPSEIPAVMTGLSLKNGIYQSKEFRGNDRIISFTFPKLRLTVAQTLEAC